MIRTEDNISAVIVSNSLGGPGGKAGGVTGLVGTITYRGLIQTDNGSTEEVFIGRPIREAYEPPQHVYPLRINSKINGKRIATGSMTPAAYEWDYTETPFSVPCNQLP